MVRDERAIEDKIKELEYKLEEHKKQIGFSDMISEREYGLNFWIYLTNIHTLEWVLGERKELELGKFE